VLSDATKSVSRAYINNFQDKSKQIAIDMFLARPVHALSTFLLTDIHAQGNLSDQQPVTIFDPIHDTVRVALEQRYPIHWRGSSILRLTTLMGNRRTEYSSPKHCTIFTGTWNLNGKVSAPTRVRFSISLWDQSATIHGVTDALVISTPWYAPRHHLSPTH